MRSRRVFLTSVLVLLGALCVRSTDARSQVARRVMEPADIIWIGAGAFTRGATALEMRWGLERCRRDSGGLDELGQRCPEHIFAIEGPARRIELSAYGIDRTEVSQQAYRRCVFAGVCPPSASSPDDGRVAGAEYPVVGVAFQEAARYCEYVGGRLPTESEWERAARGRGRARRYPWGALFNDRLANHGRDGRPEAIDGHRYAAPVDSFPEGASPDGLVNMAGNVWEWTSDRFELRAYGTGPSVDPTGPRYGGERIVRGGSWRSAAYALRVTHRLPVAEGERAPDLGFRCAYDVH